MQRPNPYKQLGETLRQARESVDMSQEALAEIACVSQQTFSRWERGLSAPDIVQAGMIERVTGKDLRVF